MDTDGVDRDGGNDAVSSGCVVIGDIGFAAVAAVKKKVMRDRQREREKERERKR